MFPATGGDHQGGCEDEDRLERLDPGGEEGQTPKMISKPLKWVGAGTGFVLVLLYATMASMPDGPPTGVEHTAEAAASACEASVGNDLREPHFPFAARATYLGDARYQLEGTVEEVLAGERVRRNYRCFVHYSDARRYVTDSLTVWQSH